MLSKLFYSSYRKNLKRGGSYHGDPKVKAANENMVFFIVIMINEYQVFV